MQEQHTERKCDVHSNPDDKKLIKTKLYQYITLENVTTDVNNDDVCMRSTSIIFQNALLTHKD